MSEREPMIPSLTSSTVPLAEPRSLTRLMPPRHQLLWQRRGDGIAGFGEALRLEFGGASRFRDAALAWREVAARAEANDPVAVPGSGLVAFGTFAFSDHSASTSVLIVPSLIVGRREGQSWVTRIHAEGVLEPPFPQEREPRPRVSLDFGGCDMDSDAYLAAVGAALGRIGAADLSKVVVARDLVGALPDGAETATALSALADGYPDCWTFAVDELIGSSPETLVRVADGTVTARVLAGSAARGVDSVSDEKASVALATSAKDQDEHRYAVQSVLAALRPHSSAVTSSEVPFTLRLPNLWHLASEVEGVLSDGSSALDLIGALHPTAAVAGTPTTAAIALIDELEPFDRGRYAGPVGWVDSNGDGEWAIALRCAQVGSDGVVRAHAGAGIVADSVAEHELAETSLKFRPIVEAFSA